MGGPPPPNGVQDWSVTASEPSQTVEHPAKRRKKVFRRNKSTPVALFMAKIPFWGFSGSRRPEKRISPGEKKFGQKIFWSKTRFLALGTHKMCFWSKNIFLKQKFKKVFKKFWARPGPMGGPPPPNGVQD